MPFAHFFIIMVYRTLILSIAMFGYICYSFFFLTEKFFVLVNNHCLLFPLNPKGRSFCFKLKCQYQSIQDMKINFKLFISFTGQSTKVHIVHNKILPEV